MTIQLETIALSKLVPSEDNVRRTGRAERIEELAASIEAHGLLQNLTVRPAAKDRFEVIAGGRRLAALKLLAKRKVIAKDAPIHCQLIGEENATEISLAENALQCPMHPADQFEAFTALQCQQMSVEDIAARFGISPKTVTQRLKLGAVSPALMDIYRCGDMNLEQLSAFAMTDDHEHQERVWQELGHNRSRRAILQALNEGQVPDDDRRAVYIGAEAYVAAGGEIIRDLFDEDDGCLFSDAALLNRLVIEKLTLDADAVTAEGWHWVSVVPSFEYDVAAKMRRIYPIPRELTDEERARLDALTTRYNALCEGEDEPADTELDDLETEIETLRGDNAYRDDDKIMAGAFVSLGHDGTPRIERGFVRSEDDSKKGGGIAGKRNTPKDALPASLIADLTAHRTAALGNELAQRPDLALVVMVHTLAAQLFYRAGDDASCLKIRAQRIRLDNHAEDIATSRATSEMEERHATWQQRMPETASDLWSFVLALPDAERLQLLAHCVSLSVNAVRTPKMAELGDDQRMADSLASELSLDMAAYWQPTVTGYLGRVPKPRILEAVREAISPEKAQTLEDLKKPAMAERAETMLVGKGWLPQVLRTAA